MSKRFYLLVYVVASTSGVLGNYLINEHQDNFEALQRSVQNMTLKNLELDMLKKKSDILELRLSMGHSRDNAITVQKELELRQLKRQLLEKLRTTVNFHDAAQLVSWQRLTSNQIRNELAEVNSKLEYREHDVNREKNKIEMLQHELLSLGYVDDIYMLRFNNDTDIDSIDKAVTKRTTPKVNQGTNNTAEQSKPSNQLSKENRTNPGIKENQPTLCNGSNIGKELQKEKRIGVLLKSILRERYTTCRSIRKKAVALAEKIKTLAS